MFKHTEYIKYVELDRLERILPCYGGTLEKHGIASDTGIPGNYVRFSFNHKDDLAAFLKDWNSRGKDTVKPPWYSGISHLIRSLF